MLQYKALGMTSHYKVFEDMFEVKTIVADAS